MIEGVNSFLSIVQPKLFMLVGGAASRCHPFWPFLALNNNELSMVIWEQQKASKYPRSTYKDSFVKVTEAG